MSYFNNLLGEKEQEMEDEDREKILRWLKNAKRLLAERPFIYFPLFCQLADDINDEISDFTEIYPLLVEAQWTDSQIMEFLYISYNNEMDNIYDFIKKMSWDNDRAWQAIKDMAISDGDMVLLLRYFNKDINFIVNQFKSDNWSYSRIIHALGDCYSVVEKVSALTINSNDFRVIELLPQCLVESSDLLDNMPGWDLDRIVRAFDSAGYSYGNIYDILINNDRSVGDIWKSVLRACFNHLSAIKSILCYDDGYREMFGDLISALKNNQDTIDSASQILSQLDKSSFEITYFLENGFFE